MAEELTAAETAAAAQVAAAGAAAAQQAQGEGLSEADVQKRVEMARQQEKDKLYPQLEEMRTALKEVQDALRAEREEKVNARTEAERKAEEERVAKLSADDRQLEVLRRLEEQLTVEREERRKLAETMESQRRADALKTYRDRALLAAGDEILPELAELVSGNTEAEIDNAIRKAKSRSEEIVKRFKETRGEQVRNTLGSVTNPGTAALEEQELSETLSTVDTERYLTDEKYREQVQNELARAYGSSTRF